MYSVDTLMAVPISTTRDAPRIRARRPSSSPVSGGTTGTQSRCASASISASTSSGARRSVARYSSTSLVRITGSTIATRSSSALLGLLDLVVDVEQREVHRDDDHADDAAHEDDHDRLHDRGQRLDGSLDLVVVEVRDLGEHGVDGTR